ncbi:uncharacterized protein LOC113749803 [Coffea eugenioides]|uniref:uncharacterized protein LOC113749803 n=1 Tax=Coffea eugenioides TaxID=49369 RepID=UPI000F60E415|nr:uncharacterized protein LOC113749803 [Coffea eugenioides]XP_027149464.1 uncharacterized protein LOC113749803 [Coffea eugenioides]XP_027149465.1 uncharacterized protein LOC113749803 [Coffea eugenioides]
MGYGEEEPHWSVFDGVKTIPASADAVIAEIDSAISALEYARATAFLYSIVGKSDDGKLSSKYDAKKADEAYKAGMAAMAAGKLDEAIQFLNIALAKCPPDKTSAVAKLQSLISVTSQQLRNSSN